MDFEKRMRELQARAEDLQPAFDEIGSTIVDHIKMGFIASESPWGESWAPLTRRQGQPLRDTGKLMNSITYRADDDGVDIGSSDLPEKAAHHQFGSAKTSGRGSGVPARPFMPLRDGGADLPEDWTQSILDVLNRHFEP